MLTRPLLIFINFLLCLVLLAAHAPASQQQARPATPPGPVNGVTYVIDSSQHRFEGSVPAVTDHGAGYYAYAADGRAIYRNWWVGGWQGPKQRVSEPHLREMAGLLPPRGIWILNIEHWPLDIRRHPEAQVRESMQRILAIIEVVRQRRPDVTIGFYSFPPLRDYWVPINLELREQQLRDRQIQPTDARLAEARQAYEQWEQASEFLRPLADAVDIICPSLYLFYNRPEAEGGDRENMRADRIYIEHNMRQAHRFGKPVWAFMMPFVHETSVPEDRRHISDIRWKAALEAIRGAGGSGIVYWDFRRGEGDYERNLKGISLDVFGRYLPPWRESMRREGRLR